MICLSKNMQINISKKFYTHNEAADYLKSISERLIAGGLFMCGDGWNTNETKEGFCCMCGKRTGQREVALFKGMVVELWKVLKWCEEKGRFEFKRKEINYLLGQVGYARFGDWIYFGGLVYKKGKGEYGLNVERCNDFFSGKGQIPLSIWKDAKTKKIAEYGELGKINQVKGVVEFLDSDNLFVAKYRNN